MLRSVVACCGAGCACGACGRSPASPNKRSLLICSPKRADTQVLISLILIWARIHGVSKALRAMPRPYIPIKVVDAPKVSAASAGSQRWLPCNLFPRSL